MPAIEIHNLKKTYANGTEALKGIDLTVESGDFCALLGANGAGKTTVINILTGLVIKTGGEAKVHGYDVVTQASQARKLMGVVPQEMNFNLFEKVQDIIVNEAGYFGVDRKTALERSEPILKQLLLWNQREHQSRSLSGGMKRRLMIARALITEPKLLILDEPTAGVDVELRYSMWEFLRELNKKGTTVLLTTHYLEEVEQMCRNAAIIKNGEIISYDKVSRLVNLLEKENYIIHVDQARNLDKLKHYLPIPIDDERFEIELQKQETMNDFIARLTKLGMVVHDIRPKANRMEKLYLKILQQ